MTPDTSGDGMPSLSRAEHSSLAKAKRVQFRGVDPADGAYYNATVRALGSNVAINAAIVDGSGNQVTSFGGGTQYTEGDTDTSITGTALMWEDASDTLRAVSAAKPLPVDLQDATVAVTQSGTWDEVGINDSGNSITVDAPVGTPVFVRLSDGASAISTLPVSLASVPSHAVTNAGTFAVQESGSALTALQLIDDTVATLGTTTYSEATTKGLIMGAVRRDADTTLVDTTNEVSPLQVDANGRLKVEAFSGETLPVSLASVPSHAVTNAGTFATQVDGAALTALQLIDDPVFADDAAYTLGTSKGNVVEGVAVETDGTDPTTVSAEGDAAALRTDRQRVLLVNPTPPRHWSVSADYGSAQTNTSVKAAPGSGLKLYITDISISNGATAGNITLLDGSGGTVLYEIYPAINGGAVDNRRSPIVLTANTALCITSTTVTTHSVNISGYIAP